MEDPSWLDQYMPVIIGVVGALGTIFAGQLVKFIRKTENKFDDKILDAFIGLGGQFQEALDAQPGKKVKIPTKKS